MKATAQHGSLMSSPRSFCLACATKLVAGRHEKHMVTAGVGYTHNTFFGQNIFKRTKACLIAYLAKHEHGLAGTVPRD